MRIIALFWVAFCLCSLFAKNGSLASVKVKSTYIFDARFAPGGEVPWPWGSELPFPWESIAGTWSAEGDNFYTWFSFEVQPTQTGSQPMIRVRQIDPLTHLEVASGLGFEDNRVVRAYMIGKSSRYFISVRAYRTEGDHGPILNNSVTVLSMSSTGSTSDFMYHLVLSKISDNPITLHK